MRVFWSILLVGLAACGFNPHPQNGALPCDNGCPSGYHCAKDGTCRTTELGADASSPSDGRAGDTGVTSDTPSASGDAGGPAGTGGAGGVTSTGGLTGSGGTSGIGGVLGTGGSVGSGGATASGGLTGSGGTSGIGGIVGTGGSVGSGGVFASGGLTGSGGIVGSGGLVGSGGTTGAGGVVGTGGIVGTGGTVGTGRDWSVCSPQDLCQTGYTCTADWKCVLVGSGGTTGGGGVTGTGGIVGTGGTMGSGGTIVPGLAVFAGVPSGRGSADGTGAAARFYWPVGVAVDGSGNFFVADTDNNTIRRITPAGVVTTLAGTAGSSGSADGTGAAARFWNPEGVAVDGSGNVFVADSWNNTIRKITPSGVVTTLAGGANQTCGSADGTGAAASFCIPTGVAVDGTGNIFVADSYNNTIRKITASGVVTTLAGTAGSHGSVDGTGAAASFSMSFDPAQNSFLAGTPSGVAVDGAGNVFVADWGNNNIRKITPRGVVTTLAGSADQSPGSADGTGAAASFNWPEGVAVDGSGNVFVADSRNNTIRRITPAGVVTTLAGTAGSWGSADGTGAAARFNGPSGVAVDGAGNVFVADSDNTIRKITPTRAVTTFAGTADSTGSSDGTGATARFSSPSGVAVDGAGDVFVADSDNNTIRKITPTRAVTTFAGTADSTGSSDGTGATARFSSPSGVAVDGAGNVFVADSGNNTIRKITPAGMVTTLAGAASSGSADGTGAAARFNSPESVAVDGAGNVFVADWGNSTIRKITPSGVVTTFAGTAGSYGSADGTGAAASFSFPTGVAVDGSGNLFVADLGNSTIRKITPAGVVTTLAGTAGSSGSADGTGAAARFNGPHGVAVDGSGDVFVADTGNNAIRKISTSGVVTTIVGVAAQVSAGNLPGPLPASILSPSGVAIDASTGKLYITLPDAVMVAVLPK